MSSSLIASNYMTRFACLGGECEDTCCARWSVTVDEEHVVGLERLLVSAADRARFAATFQLLPEERRRPQAYATIRMREDTRRCPMLDDDALCSLHKRFGEAVLPDVCASYPRRLRDMAGRLELGGSMSCPEIVRQALLVDDGLDLIEADGAVAGRAPLVERVSAEDAPVLDEVRGWAMLILDRPGESLASRLYLLAYVAEVTAEVLADDPAALTEELEAALDDDALDALAAEAREPIAPDEHALAALVMQVGALRSVVEQPLGVELDRVIDRYAALGVLDRAAPAAGTLASDGFTLRTGFTEACLALGRQLPSPVVAAVDTWLDRYARAWCWSEPWPAERDVRAWVRTLAARLAALRFFLLGHPDAAAGVDATARWLVRLVYQSARVVEHDAEVKRFMSRDLDRLLPSLESLRALLSLVSPPPAAPG